MASYSQSSLTKISIILFSVFLLIEFAQSQGLGPYDQDCGGCWDDLEATVEDLERASTSSGYRHKTGGSVLLNSVDPAGQLRSDFVRRLFRRAAAAGSSPLECDTCWVVLNRLRTWGTDQGQKEILDVGHLVKKAMLNNGWV